MHFCAAREPRLERVAFHCCVEHDYFCFSEITDANLSAVKLAGKAMGSNGRVLGQQDVGPMRETTVSKSLMQRCSPVIELRFHGNN
jgi:hypothetical protein